MKSRSQVIYVITQFSRLMKVYDIVTAHFWSAWFLQLAGEEKAGGFQVSMKCFSPGLTHVPCANNPLARSKQPLIWVARVESFSLLRFMQTEESQGMANVPQCSSSKPCVTLPRKQPPPITSETWFGLETFILKHSSLLLNLVLLSNYLLASYLPLTGQSWYHRCWLCIRFLSVASLCQTLRWQSGEFSYGYDTIFIQSIISS